MRIQQIRKESAFFLRSSNSRIAEVASPLLKEATSVFTLPIIVL